MHCNVLSHLALLRPKDILVVLLVYKMIYYSVSTNNASGFNV